MKYALIVANTDYQDESFSKLTAPAQDAERFAHVLRGADLAAFDDVQVLLNEGEGKTRRAIARFFSEGKPDDLLLFYFSGHGIRNDAGGLFLAANDTEIKYLSATGVPATFVTDAMNNSRSRRQVLILDCCNSGAFAHGTKSSAALGKSMGTASAFEGSGFGRVVLTASDATQFAWEGDKVIGKETRNSLFTHFLIEGLKGEADRDGDGRVTVDDLYDYAYAQVAQRTPKQTPGKWSYKQQGEIVLRENVRPREVKPAPLPADLLEALSLTNVSARRAGIQELEALLNGKHVGLARAAEEKLREIAENDDSYNLRQMATEVLAGRTGTTNTPPVTLGTNNSPTKKPTKPDAGQSFPIKGGPSAPDESMQRDAVPLSSRVIDKSKSRKRTSTYAIVTGVLVGLVLFFGGRAVINNISAQETSIPSPTFMFEPLTPTKIVSTSTSILPTWTPTPTLTPTEVASISTSISPTFMFGPPIGSTMVSEKDGMTLVFVPAGNFAMGSDDGDDDEKPVHTVYLDAYWIDRTEVTNTMYALCVNAGVCSPPGDTSSSKHSTYYGNSKYDDYPVI